MPEPNGSGRLDRIEALLEKLAERTTTTAWLHEERLLKIEANIEQMQEDEKAYRLAQRERDAVADGRAAAAEARVDRLVSAIGEMVSRVPPKPRAAVKQEGAQSQLPSIPEVAAWRPSDRTGVWLLRRLGQ